STGVLGPRGAVRSTTLIDPDSKAAAKSERTLLVLISRSSKVSTRIRMSPNVLHANAKSTIAQEYADASNRRWCAAVKQPAIFVRFRDCVREALDVALRRCSPDICVWRLIGGDESGRWTHSTPLSSARDTTDSPPRSTCSSVAG